MSEDPIESIFEISKDYKDFQEAAIAATYFVLNGVALEPRDKTLAKLKELAAKPNPSESEKVQLRPITANAAQIAAMIRYRSTNGRNHYREIVGLGVDPDENQNAKDDFMRLDFEPKQSDTKAWKAIHFNATPLNAQGGRSNPRLKFSANIRKGDRSSDSWQAVYDDYIYALNRFGIASMIWDAWSHGRVAG